jgi:hypothetical protein
MGRLSSKFFDGPRYGSRLSEALKKTPTVNAISRIRIAAAKRLKIKRKVGGDLSKT